MTDGWSRERLGWLVVGVPLVVAALGVVYTAAAEQTAWALVSVPSPDPDVNTAAWNVGLVALAVVPLLLTGLRAVGGRLTVVGAVGAYGYAGLVAFVLLFLLGPHTVLNLHSGRRTHVVTSAAPVPPDPVLLSVIALGGPAGVLTAVGLARTRRTYPDLGASRLRWVLAYHPWVALPALLVPLVVIILLPLVGVLVTVLLLPAAWVVAVVRARSEYDSVVDRFAESARETVVDRTQGTADTVAVVVGEDGVGRRPPFVRRLVATAIVVGPEGVTVERVGVCHLPTLAVSEPRDRRRLPSGSVEGAAYDRSRLVVRTDEETVTVPARERPDSLLSTLDERAPDLRPGVRDDDRHGGDPSVDADGTRAGDDGPTAIPHPHLRLPGRRALLGTAVATLVALLGGVAVGRDLPVRGGSRPPAAAFDFDHDDAAGTVTVLHAGGDSFSADDTGRLLVASDDRRTTWSLPVIPGDEVILPADPGETVRVVWSPPRYGERVTVGSFEVPE